MAACHLLSHLLFISPPSLLPGASVAPLSPVFILLTPTHLLSSGDLRYDNSY